jgi:putative exosortase-associated protein (TIGR04073 family)
MIGRGALNVVTSPVDVIVNVVNETKAGPPFVGTLSGLGKGLGCGTLRLGSGAVDLVTFWVPGFNGFPVSDSYEDCLEMNPSTSGEMPSGYPSSTWEVPTAEPGAAHVPAAEPPAKKTWKK